MPRLSDLHASAQTRSSKGSHSARDAGERPHSGDDASSALAQTGMTNLDRKGATVHGGPLLEWAVVQDIDAKEAALKDEETRQRRQKMKQDHLKQLDAQRDRQVKEKDEHRQLWLRWRTEVEADAEAYHQEEEQKKQKKIEVQRRFDEDRRQQLVDKRSRQTAQQEADAQEGENMLRASKEALRRAEEQESVRKQRGRVEAIKLAESAQIAKADKEMKKQAEYKHDIVLAKQQQELLDKQEEERSMFFKKLKEKQLKLLSAYEAGVGNELEKKQKEDDERAKRYQTVLVEKENKAAELKEIKYNEMKQARREAVESQLQEHALQKKRQKEEESELLQKVRQQAEVDAAKEQARRETKRRARQANAGELLEQIRQREQTVPYRQSRDQMNEVERRMNRAKLQTQDAPPHSARGDPKDAAKSAPVPRQPQTAR